MSHVFYDPADLNKVVAYYSDDTTGPWPGMTKLANPSGAFAVGVDIRHHKIVGSTITEMTQPEKDARPLVDLAAYKKQKQAKIDARTVQLIGQGFLHAGKMFSLSAPAQRYWSNLLNVPATDYPLRVNTRDDDDAHNIADAVEAQSVYGAALSTVKGHLASGTALKDQVRAATTQAGVDAVVDNR